MIGRIFMNQESKAINVHLEKRENKDYLVFGFEEVAEVCLNDDESQNNLKSIFVKLLTEITKYPVELQFLENPEYKTGLYIDVCKEYIKDLNKEIMNVRKNMPRTANGCFMKLSAFMIRQMFFTHMRNIIQRQKMPVNWQNSWECRI